MMMEIFPHICVVLVDGKACYKSLLTTMTFLIV